MAHSVTRWTFWSVMCVQLLLLMVYSTRAVRMLQSLPRRLQAFSDDSGTPRHAPAVASFLVSDGTWVDCVPIEGQIAAHHPALKDHVIQMIPSSSRSKLHPQRFAREHGGCPDGSIPVLRTDPFRDLQKTCSRFPTLSTGSEYAVAHLPETTQSPYTGAHTTLSVNDPALGDPATDFSLSQLWIVDVETSDIKTLSTIEVGWQKFPSFHQNLNDGDPNAPHLFIFWTNDDYQSGGPGTCYNILNCMGFVQTNKDWVIGGAMPSYTTLAQNASTESEVEIEVLYDTSAQVWRLSLNQDAIGYWPADIFNGRLQGAAVAVQWGGDVVFYERPNRTKREGASLEQKAEGATTTTHSTTAMGSGAFPSAGYPVAAYHKDITYADAAGTFTSPVPTELSAIVSHKPSYDIAIEQDADTGSTYFYFGRFGSSNRARGFSGPGRSDRSVACPTRLIELRMGYS